MLAPLIIPLVVAQFGTWRAAFVWTFPVALIWLFCWLRFYSKPELKPGAYSGVRYGL
jgi:hypothetical protein